VKTRWASADRKKENILSAGQLSGLVLEQCFFKQVGMLLAMKTLED